MHDQLMSLEWYKLNFVISHDLYEKNDEWYNCVSYFVGYIYYVKYKSSNNHYTVDSNILDRIYTHGNKLGNTFSPWGKFEKIHFPYFW